ncbi:pyrrolidone-carboxylate peptidase [Haladaptatus paucihalophilus DX253]|uniref:Pyroglutamyl-peptidase I n=1 Tax=Haladaptatus paucihalophilus DX253 TaxID=797209 RepID=E7QUP4_HALPU|nr:peptidase [Haladaptatus paucihalophilus]EFW91701.1 pyrrolidone-carboxylate peptidase [Haladaptatus paucihalophilus DX253]SHJ96657.1 pyroglutamyl-peptidase [Haladaptatus paucihalophilus DX253]
MTLLLTGYEPFGDDDENPSEMVARELDGEELGGHEIVGEVLPVEFDAAFEAMRDHIETHDPTAIVATGLAAGRAGISVERVGINVNDSGSTPDNAGAEPRNERIRGGEAAGYFATLPVVSVVESLLDAGIPAHVSNTAGTHLCNNALYSTRAYLERENRDVPMGFVHLPCTPELAAKHAEDGNGTSGASVQPSMPLSMQCAAIRRTFDVTLEE